MSIVTLSKVMLYGPAAEKDTVLDGLQSLGCVHLNNLQPGAGTSVVESSCTNLAQSRLNRQRAP
jgi:vacuolar-type H+-ATPase subunit I/STV1